MKNLFLCGLLLAMGMSQSALATESKSESHQCAALAKHLGVQYHIVETHVVDTKKNQTRTEEKDFNLWRNDGLVAHEYLDTKLTFIWNQTPNGQLKGLQAFDDYDRAIEYEPRSAREKHKGEAWQEQYQLFSEATLSAMTLKVERGSGCEREQEFERVSGDTKRRLVWLPELKIARSYSAHNKGNSVEWTAKELIREPKKVSAAISRRLDYQTTDYADVGDNESDPFLLKMVNLGFIAHGSEGFYDADGHPLQGHHH